MAVEGGQVDGEEHLGLPLRVRLSAEVLMPGRVNFVTVHHQFVFVILSLPKTLHYNGGRHLNMIEMSLGKICRPRLFTETQMSPTLSTSINVSDFIKQIEWP